MQADGVVVLDELADDAAGVFRGQRGARADALLLEDAVPAFDLAVALRVVRRGPGVRHAALADERLEVPRDELRAIVGDDPRRDAGEAFAGPLDDLLDVGLGHALADLPVDTVAAAAVEQAAQVVEGAGDVEVGDIDVPVLVGAQRLHEALALSGRLGGVAVEAPGLLEDAVDAGRAAVGDIGIDHHEGQPAVALQREQLLEVEDGLLLVGLEPMVARDPGVVLVGLAVALLPGVPLGGGEVQPAQEAGDGDAGLAGPVVDEVDDLVAGVVGNPASFQSSPSAFFSRTCSSRISERTSCLRKSLSWSSAIWRSFSSTTDLRRLSVAVKAAWPFSKKSFCQE